MPFDITVVLYEYTEILTGMRRSFSMDFFDGTKDENEKHAIRTIRIVTRSFLRCTSLAVARETITVDLLKKMKLQRLLAQIQVPPYVASTFKDEYLIAKIYSNGFDEEPWTLARMCERIIGGDMKKFPKRYMEEADGMRRAEFCLRYFLNHDYPLWSGRQLYMFACTPEFREYLRLHLLHNVCSRLYSTPVEYVHNALPKDLRDDMFFRLREAVYKLDGSKHFSIRAKPRKTTQKE